MKAHVSGDQIERYLSRTLEPAEVLALHEHTAACPDCRKALGDAALARMPSGSVPLLWETAEVHLSEDEMVAFTARRMAETQRARASRHLSECELCRESVEAMELARDQAAKAPLVRFRVPTLAVAGAVAAAAMMAVLLYRPAPERAVKSGGAAPPALARVRDGGGTIELDAQGGLHGLDAAPPEERNLVREALERASLPVGPALPAEAPGVLMGAGNAAPPPFAPLGPLNVRVLSDRPVFTWQPYAGAEHYQVLVTNENFDPLARSGMIAVTAWQPEKALPRGVRLLWQVRAWRGGEMVSAPAPPAPPARFEIAGEQIAAWIEQVRSAPQPSHLLAAVLCAQAGLREEAARELEALARENPDSKLVASLQSGVTAR